MLRSGRPEATLPAPVTQRRYEDPRRKTIQALGQTPPDDGVAMDYLDAIDDILVLDRAIEAADKRRDLLLSNLHLRRRMLGAPPVVETDFDLT